MDEDVADADDRMDGWMDGMICSWRWADDGVGGNQRDAVASVQPTLDATGLTMAAMPGLKLQFIINF
jgi:hypothetical protein